MLENKGCAFGEEGYGAGGGETGRDSLVPIPGPFSPPAPTGLLGRREPPGGEGKESEGTANAGSRDHQVPHPVQLSVMPPHSSDDGLGFERLNSPPFTE